jgi:hypothetical protein
LRVEYFHDDGVLRGYRRVLLDAAIRYVCANGIASPNLSDAESSRLEVLDTSPLEIDAVTTTAAERTG